MMELYKDSKGINHRSAISDNLKELAEIVSGNNYNEVLLPTPWQICKHQDEHIHCTMRASNSQERVTEKRICRCWNYFNKPENKEGCNSCSFVFKKENVGHYEILDYEVPTVFSMEQLGGIDWLLKRENELIAAEVKPPNSQETIVRMIAEILTYTIETSYTPAICFFLKNVYGKPSKQYVDYVKYKDNEHYKFIKEKTGLQVLYITFDENTFCIHNEEEEPLE